MKNAIQRQCQFAGFYLLLFLLCSSGAQAQQADSNKARLILPPVIYAVPGFEANLYFDNVILVLNRNDYAFDVICTKGIQLAERWTFTPEAADVGDYPLEVIVRDGNNSIVSRG